MILLKQDLMKQQVNGSGLCNPTEEDLDISGWSLQRAAQVDENDCFSFRNDRFRLGLSVNLRSI